MDQTFVRLQNTYKKTLSPKGAKEVRAVQPPEDPECHTVCLTICADDSEFPAFIVFEGNKKTGKLSPKILNKLVMPENVRIFSTRPGWWNSAFDQFWISETFDERHDGETLIRGPGQEEIMDSREHLEASFECSFSSVEDSFTEE
ncbi:hypothetical protein RvY_16810 [Ramazzottius varieornatus]|uniref:DDE-1 domain-containing protein n=1 Tax=Ramazzottius varieornatus TaxID=947166 RepID=A0A1D1W758_RAMVA|nr:hypothetical protein RvY_16810 [Ramazzottius varieornatus]